MSLDTILEELQLTHKSKSGAPKADYGTRGEGAASLDQLDDAARGKYRRFLIEPDRHTRRAHLTSGDDSDYQDDTSAADFALACDLLQEGFKPGDVEIIMRATRYRDKFDELRGPTTYLARTLNHAMESVAEGSSTPPTKLATLSIEQGCISIPTTPPPPRDYVWDKRMVAGHAYVLGGFGGASKSQAALQFAASIAMGIPFGNSATKKGCALLIFGEDDLGEISRRIGAYAAHDNLSPDQRTEVEKNIRAFGLIGDDTRLTATRSGVHESTSFAGVIIAAAVELEKQSEEPIRLIVLDHAGLFHGGDFNAREDVSLTMRIVNHIAHETGAAVLLLAHSPKSSSGNDDSSASDIAGSTTFVDQTRGAFILATMRKTEAKKLGISDAMRHQYVSLAVVKNNYGKTGEVSWFERISPLGWEVGVLVPADLQPAVKEKSISSATTLIQQFIAEHPGQYSKTSLRDKHSGKDSVLKASKTQVENAVDMLLAGAHLISRAPTPEERKGFGLTQQTKFVLDVPAKES